MCISSSEKRALCLMIIYYFEHKNYRNRGKDYGIIWIWKEKKGYSKRKYK